MMETLSDVCRVVGGLEILSFFLFALVALVGPEARFPIVWLVG